MLEINRKQLKKSALEFLQSYPGHHKLTTNQLADLLVNYIENTIPADQEIRDHQYPETHIDYKRMDTIEAGYRKMSYTYGVRWVLDKIFGHEQNF